MSVSCNIKNLIVYLLNPNIQLYINVFKNDIHLTTVVFIYSVCVCM